MLSTDELETYVGLVRSSSEDIEKLMSGYKSSDGDAHAFFRETIVKKLWALSKIVGEHYLSALKVMADIEAEVTENPHPQTQTQLEQMTEVVGQCRVPSDSPSAEEVSEPSE